MMVVILCVFLFGIALWAGVNTYSAWHRSNDPLVLPTVLPTVLDAAKSAADQAIADVKAENKAADPAPGASAETGPSAG